MQVETRQDEPSGWCFRRDVDWTSFSLMIPFQTWETLKYELKPSIFFSKTAWWCLCMFVQFSAIFRLRLSELVNVFRSNEWFRNDRTGCFPLDAKHDETLGCMPQAMTQKVIDIEEIIKSDHLYATDATAAAEDWCFFIQSSRNQKTDKWCLSLNHVESCFRMLRSTSLDSEPDDACIFFMQVKRYNLTALVWTAKWRNWCRTNLGLETAPIKSFISKTRFVSLGSYCALPSIAGKLQIEVIEVTLHGARELPIFTWPVVAANGVIVLCMVVFCLELFMPRALIPGV